MSLFFKFLSVVVFSISFTALNYVHAATALTEQQWQQLTQKTVSEGIRSDSVLGTLLTLTVKKIVDENNYEVFYFSTLGQITPEGFVVKQLTLVNESWRRAGENQVVNQRSYLFDAAGNLSNLYHRELIKTSDGGISVKDVPTEGIDSANEHQTLLKLISVFVP